MKKLFKLLSVSKKHISETDMILSKIEINEKLTKILKLLEKHEKR